MNIPDSVAELAREVVCRALAKWTRRPGVLGALFKRIEALACDAAADASREAYQRGWSDANLASISALANEAKPRKR